MRFEAKVVIVTGGASGIGAATVRRLAREGASVVVADIRETAINELITSEEPGASLVGHVVDMADPEAVEAMIDSVFGKFGRLDILVNNAGMGSYGAARDIGLQHWRELMTIDVEAVFWTSRCALPHLAARRGSIVNVASVSGLAGDYGFLAYNAAKAAVINLTRAMAIDEAGSGVRVNSVSPGLTRTPLAAGLHTNPEIMAGYAEAIPLGRPAEASEVAAAIAFLASEDASYITGHNLVVDGGMTAHTGQPNFRRILGDTSHLAGAETVVR